MRHFKAAEGEGHRIGFRRSPALVTAEADQFFECLGRKCAEAFKIPGTTRHEIRCEILPAVKAALLPQAKFLVELLIFGAKSRGYFCLDALSSCERFMAYLRERSSPNVVGAGPAELLHELTEAGMLKTARLDHFTCDPAKLGSQAEEYFKVKTDRSVIDAARLTELFANLAREFDIDIANDADPTLRFRFPGAKPIRSMEEFEKIAERILDVGDNISVCSLRGEWLARPQWSRRLKGKRVQVVIMGDAGPENEPYWTLSQGSLNRLKESGYKVFELDDRSFDLHITMNESEAIVFRRPHRRPITSPYLIQNQVDYAKVQSLFDKMLTVARPL